MGAKANARNKAQKTPLFNAAATGNVRAIELLLEHGAELEAKDEDGDTALTWAAMYGRPQAVRTWLPGAQTWTAGVLTAARPLMRRGNRDTTRSSIFWVRTVFDHTF